MLHGIEIDANGQATWFRFGMLPVVHRLSLFGEERPKNAAVWTKRWGSLDFFYAVKKFQDTIWKFDRAAGHVDRCRKAVQTWAEREARGEAEEVHISEPDLIAYRTALEDLPLYLDLMLFYLRIEVDAFAALIPYFYDRAGVIKERSFRGQKKWFLSKNPTLDPEYTRILTEPSTWFDQLAGKNPTGLRDLMVHDRGSYQLGWTKPAQENAFALRASVRNSRGLVQEDDLLTALAGIQRAGSTFLICAALILDANFSLLSLGQTFPKMI